MVVAARRHAAGATVAVITPYSAQRQEVMRALGDDASSVRVSTVDGFQGQEADVARGFLRTFTAPPVDPRLLLRGSV